jgi:hypothetical protein
MHIRVFPLKSGGKREKGGEKGDSHQGKKVTATKSG